MSFKIKASAPVKDGVIVYCAASSQGSDGYTAVVLRNKHVEFQYDMADGKFTNNIYLYGRARVDS